MTYDEFIAYYGSQQKAATRLGVGQTTVTHWKRVGIPIDRQIAIEVETEGKLKADLPEQVRSAEARAS